MVSGKNNKQLFVTIADMLYPASSNSLELHDQVMPRFKCPLDLEMYPWDSQICNITLKVANVKAGHMHFIQHSLHYQDKQQLQEYLLRDWRLDTKGNRAMLSFRLVRRYEKHVWTTLVPTSLLLAISYGTLFIPAESFSERGTMSLTTLLVLVSLYTEALSSLPVTSYNKQIEKWYLYLIIYVSLVITVHLLTSNPVARRALASDGCKPKIFWTRPKQSLWRQPDAKTVLVVARVVFGVALVLTLILFSLNAF